LAGPGTSLLVGIAPEWATAREPVEPLPEVSSIGIPGQRLQPEGALDELERGRVLERPEIGDARGGEVGDDDDLCDLVIMRSGMVCTWSCQH
jgi:hypothetical protein